MKNSYKDDCIFLLKELQIEEITIKEKERLISEGISYSNMISKENEPSEEIMDIFYEMLQNDKLEIASYVAKIATIMFEEKGKDLVIVSLARAGTPVGILVKKFIKKKYNVNVMHYSISIIRGNGVDKNAIDYILKNNPNGKIQFVDGWTGKGSITKELKKSMKDYEGVSPELAVLVDPAKLCRIYGTREDFGLATSCLNSTVSGLISRTIYNKDYIKEGDFHGAKYLDYLEEKDVSNYFIEEVCKEFKILGKLDLNLEEIELEYADKLTYEIKEKFNVKNINKIKLSVGETARVLLRRNPKVILVKDLKNKNIKHILKLVEERGAKVILFDCKEYNCISIIEE